MKTIYYNILGGVLVLIGWTINRFEIIPIISGFLMGIGIMYITYAKEIRDKSK